MDKFVLRVAAVFTVGFLSLIGALSYWQILDAPSLLARADNPRPYEQRIHELRGRLLDRTGRVLVESVPSGDRFERRYVYPPLVHVTGYNSPHYGNSALEARYDEYLRGIVGRSRWDLFWDTLIHRHALPEDVTLTIETDLQIVADRALGDRRGAVVVLDAQTGAILALASHPFFDPNHLEDEWLVLNRDPGRPFLSRATQGLYAPGSVFSLVTLAIALDADLVRLDEVLEVPSKLRVGHSLIQRSGMDMPRTTCLSALQGSDPVPFAQLGLRLGATTFLERLQLFGLEQPPLIEIGGMASSISRTDPVSDEDLALTAIGQGRLLVTPLHMALVMAAFAGDGSIPVPHLVVHPAPFIPSSTARPISAQTAATVRSALSPFLFFENGRPFLTGIAGCTELGSDVEPHIWFLGIASAISTRYSIVVLIENGGRDVDQAGRIAVEIAHALQQEKVTSHSQCCSH